MLVAGDILHSDVNNKEFKSQERLEGVPCTVLASFVLYHDVEFDWVRMKD